MKQSILFILLLLVIASCQERKEKVIDISEHTPQSDHDYNNVDTIQTDSIEGTLTRFQNMYSEIAQVRESDARNFLERFRPDSSENYIWYLADGDSLSYQRTVFKDSTKTKSAFFNWMDHEDISYFGANERIDREAMAILYTDTMILILKGDVDLKFWEEFFIEEEWMDEGDYWIKQRKFGKAQWFVREEDEFKDLTDL
ncbi:hypothetical protein N9Y60_05490 [Crocinitomicaceae bacterium]|nr:hypothetical protein [Crocinitomicaceae bacterium]